VVLYFNMAFTSEYEFEESMPTLELLQLIKNSKGVHDLFNSR